MVQHYIKGEYVGIHNGVEQYDTSLQGLSMLYGISWTAIADATFGGHTEQEIYGWLSINGGQQQQQDDSVYTGYHWSFAPGMVAEIPGVSASQSPIPAGVPVVPAGPAVDVNGNSEPGITPSQAGIGGGMMTWLMVAVGIYFLFGDELMGKPKRKRRRRKPAKRRKRKTTKRRRRRNYFHQFYDGDDD